MTDDDAWIQQQIIQSSNAALFPELSMKIFREKLAAYIHELINNNFLLLQQVCGQNQDCALSVFSSHVHFLLAVYQNHLHY